MIELKIGRAARGSVAERAVRNTAGSLLAAAVVMGLAAGPAPGQTRPDPPPVSAAGDTVTVVPAPAYRAGSLQRTILGDGWRELWLEPVGAQVFDFDRYAGGVDWTRRGGGNQSITLHLESREGWEEHIFRSVDKFPEQALPPAIRGTTVGWAVQDMISSLFPAAPLLVPPFMEAVDLLHVDPVLHIMPDDPRLEVYQDTFAGMLGTVELRTNEAPDDEPGFAGSSKIKGTEEFFNDLDASKDHRLDERQMLTARLVDFLINDTDRSRDNVRWARYGDEGDYHWRPIPIDRDWAFVNADGRITALASGFYPKIAAFGPAFPSMDALTYTSHVLDRRLLQRLTRDDFAQVADAVAVAITDDVIEDAIARLPESWRAGTSAPERIRAALRARRDDLRPMALDFYQHLAQAVDVQGTNEADEALVERLDDGRVRLTITWPDGDPRAGQPFYQRTFLPTETEEVRLFLQGGDDRARVVGDGTAGIIVRLVGGEGDDHLADEAGGGATHLYDAAGENRLVRTARTPVSTREWDPTEPNEGVRLGSAWAPDWGGTRGWSPAVDYGDAAGLIIGFGPTWTHYGFRRLPYRWHLQTRLLYATGAGSFGGELMLDYRLENSPLAVTLDARGITFDAFRFNGFGNSTADAGDEGLVERDLVSVAPALAWHIGWRDRETDGDFAEAGAVREDSLRPLVGRLEAGPIFLWTDPDPAPGSPFANLASDRLGTARTGLRTGLHLDHTDRDAAPRRGWRLDASAAAYTPGADLDGFLEGTASASAYLPLFGRGPHLALRAGGSAVSRDTPAEHSAWVGGRTTLRGYRWQRYRGDAAAHGSAEVRVPVTHVELLIRWNLGVFGLADAGRVWFEGESPGGWHTGFGGGLWLDALGRSLSAAYAYGEEGRLYLQTGLSF